MPQMSKMKIAITGLIGSGKSTVCNYLRDKGYHVFDCDKYNSYLLEKGNIGYLKVKEAFPEVFDNDILIKTRLSDLIFSNSENKEKLENILHPIILDKINEESKDYDPYFAEVPLLFETEFYKHFDYALLIASDNNIALKRLTLRGVNESEAKRRILNQMSLEEKKKRSDGIIYNNGNLVSLYNQIDEWLKDNVR